MKFSANIYETILESTNYGLEETPLKALLTAQYGPRNYPICTSVFGDWMMGFMAFLFGNDGNPYLGQPFGSGPVGAGFCGSSTVNAAGPLTLYTNDYINQDGFLGAGYGYHGYGTMSSLPAAYDGSRAVLNTLPVAASGDIVFAPNIAIPPGYGSPFPATPHDGEVFCPSTALYVTPSLSPGNAYPSAGTFWPTRGQYILGTFPPQVPPPSPPPPPNYFYNGFAVYPYAGKCSIMLCPILTPGTISFHTVRGDGMTLSAPISTVVTDFVPGSPVDATWGTCTGFPEIWEQFPPNPGYAIVLNAVYIPANSGSPLKLTLPQSSNPIPYPVPVNSPIFNPFFNYGSSSGQAICFWYMRQPDQLPTMDFNPATYPWSLLPQF